MYIIIPEGDTIRNTVVIQVRNIQNELTVKILYCKSLVIAIGKVLRMEFS